MKMKTMIITMKSTTIMTMKTTIITITTTMIVMKVVVETFTPVMIMQLIRLMELLMKSPRHIKSQMAT